MNVVEKLYEEIKNNYANELKTKRGHAKDERLLYVLICIVYIITVLLTFKVTSKTNSGSLLILFAFEVLVFPYILMYIYKRWSKNAEYKKEYARLIFAHILNQFKEIKKFNHIKGIEKEIYRKANFDKNDDIYKSQCYVQGLINEKYQFEMSNVYAKKNTVFSVRHSFVFDGTFIILDISKKINERIFITKQNKFTLGTPEILDNDFKIYCKNKSNNKQKINIELIKYLLGTQLFDEIVIIGSKMYIRSFKNIFEVPSIKKIPLKKERIYNYYNTYKSILDNLNKIVKEI